MRKNPNQRATAYHSPECRGGAYRGSDGCSTTSDRRQTVGSDWTRRRQNSPPCPREPNLKPRQAHPSTKGASTYHRIEWYEEDATNLNTANGNPHGGKNGGNAASLEGSRSNTLNAVRGGRSFPAASASAADPGTQESPRYCTGDVELKIMNTTTNDGDDK